MLFANDHDAGRNFVFDLRDPLHPRLANSFTDMAGSLCVWLLADLILFLMWPPFQPRVKALDQGSSEREFVRQGLPTS